MNMDKDFTNRGSFEMSFVNEGGDPDTQLDMIGEQYSSRMSKMKNNYLKKNNLDSINYDPNIPNQDGNEVSFDS